jgi:steroid 5-alpha reductase family enzyme
VTLAQALTQLWASAPWVAALFAATWIASVVRRDASLADRVWGLGFVVIAWVIARRSDSADWLVVVLVSIWGLRLAAHITVRNWGHGEDRRYRAMRERNGAGWWWQSLFWVFGLQALLCLIIALPLAVAVPQAGGGVLRLLGIGLWTIGFAFEAIGDWQLVQFTRDPANRRRVLDTGLWRYTRHPNYFGEVVLWWGLWLIAAGAGGWWTIFGPLVITLLLLRVSGVTLLEADIGARRPGYAAYVHRTSAFVPRPPRGH